MTTLSIQMVQSNMILSSLICSQGGISPRLRIPSGWDLPTLENSILETPSFSISQPLALTKAIAPSVAKIPNYYIPKYNASRPTPVMIKLRSTTVETFAVIVDSLPGATCNIGIANANGVELKNKLRVPVHGECHIFPDKGQYYSARVSTYDKPGSGSFRVLY